MEDSELVAFKEAMAMLRVSRSSIYRLIEAHKLTPITTPALTKPRVYFQRREVLALLAPKGEPPPD